jgi:hypothetical protein
MLSVLIGVRPLFKSPSIKSVCYALLTPKIATRMDRPPMVQFIDFVFTIISPSLSGDDRSSLTLSVDISVPSFTRIVSL